MHQPPQSHPWANPTWSCQLNPFQEDHGWAIVCVMSVLSLIPTLHYSSITMYPPSVIPSLPIAHPYLSSSSLICLSHPLFSLLSLPFVPAWHHCLRLASFQLFMCWTWDTQRTPVQSLWTCTRRGQLRLVNKTYTCRYALYVSALPATRIHAYVQIISIKHL